MNGYAHGHVGPLAPFLACWSMYEVIFKDGPPEPLPIPPELKEKAKREIDLNCEHYYNVAIVGVAGTGKVTPLDEQLTRVRI